MRPCTMTWNTLQEPEIALHVESIARSFLEIGELHRPILRGDGPLMCDAAAVNVDGRSEC